MSKEPRTQVTFTQGTKEELDSPPSALFYLFQEVSKLDSPTQNNFLKADPNSKWLDAVSKKDSVIQNKEEENVHQRQTSDSSSQQNRCHVFPFGQVKMLGRESRTSEFRTSDEQESKSNSPWKVLSLINFHCERLLHQKDLEEVNACSTPLTFIHSNDGLSIPALATTEEGDTEHDEEPVLSAKQQITAGCGDYVAPDCAQEENKLPSCMTDSIVGNRGQIEVPERTDAQFLTKNVTSSFEPQQRPGQENEQNQEPQPHILTSVPNTSLTFNSTDEAHVALHKPKLILDHNANILSEEHLCLNSVIPPSQSANLTSAEPSLSKQTDKITPSKLGEDDSDSQHKPPIPLPPASSQVELLTQQKEELGPSSTGQWRAKTQRKQLHPRRSANSHDPDFHGVSFTMETVMDGSKEQCRLLITSKSSRELCQNVRKPKLRKRMSQKSLKTSSSEEEIDQMTNSSQIKVCASCCTIKTPMWRDAEDGTPLCNACGIRYKKYRVRCVNCWHIPRKESNSNSCCPKCGNSVRLTSSQRKHTT